VDGRLNSYFKDVVLTEQAFVKDNKKTIAAVLKSGGADVLGFARFQVGQA
jgi:elongation factor Ts